MLKHISYNKLGHSQHGWLDSHHHFTFASYYNPDNIQFGVLRVINDDLVQPGTGFDTHPHDNMEILSYVVDGELTHEDSMKNRRKLTRGQVQYMSAGSGVWHSEFNLSGKLLRFLQIWIFPDRDGYKPNYGDKQFAWEDRQDKWLYMAGNVNSAAPIHIHADAHLYAAEISAGKSLPFRVAKDRQAYLVLIEGAAEINGHQLKHGDALEITEEDILIQAIEKSHVLAIEMAKAE